MKYIECKALNFRQKATIISLWNREYPSNLAYSKPEDFDTYLAKLDDQNHFLLLDEKEEVIAWFVDFIRDNDRWFAMIVDPKYQGKSIGSKILSRAQTKHTELNGWVINHDDYKKSDGSNYHSPIPFYRKNSFRILTDERLETPQLSAVKIQWRKHTTLPTSGDALSE